MGSEGLDRVYLNRTWKDAELNALPEIFQTLLSGSMTVVDGQFDVKEIEQNVRYLKERISKPESWSDAGVITLDLKQKFPDSDGQLVINYDSEITPNFFAACRRGNPTLDDEAAMLALKKELKDYRRIISLSLSNQQHVFNMQQHLLENYSVYAYIGDNAPLTKSAWVNPEFRLMVSSQPIDSRYGIYGLFHEVGHVRRHEELTPGQAGGDFEIRQKQSHGQRMTHPEQKTVIKSERDADAFALLNLRHFFGSEDMAFFRKLAYSGQRAYHRNLQARP